MRAAMFYGAAACVLGLILGSLVWGQPPIWLMAVISGAYFLALLACSE